MQYTFSYGDFQGGDAGTRSKTEDELIRDGADHFMNAIEALCSEFNPERLVLAIDGPAPLAKMIQQRQRRFGAKMDVGDNDVLKKSWTELINKARSRSLDKEESFVSLKIEYVQPSATMKYGEVYISPHISAIESGSPQEEVYKSLMNGLIRWATDNKVRWYNVLHPETPLGFEYDGSWWYSIASCATAYAWKEIYNQTNLITLFRSNARPPFDLGSRDNKYIYAGKPSAAIEGTVNGVLQYYTKFKARETSFFVTHASKIAEFCEKISEHVAETYPVYKQALLLTGIGTVLEQENRSKIEWLMRVRKRLIAKLETQELAPQQDVPIQESVDYPDYEYGVTDVEGINHGSSFDSNSLTPGTSVMNQIDNRIRERIRNNVLRVNGRNIKVYYSSHEEPGEGEHKIMNMIDYEGEISPDHISLVYGLDADLFMLTMVRKSGLALIRENVFRKDKFKGKIGRLEPGYSTCHVVDIGALKSLMEVHPLDFVFLCFMFGNDFLRNVPSLVFDTRLQIAMEDEPLLFDYVIDVYSGVRSSLGANSFNPIFVNNFKAPLKVQWSNFYTYLKELSKIEKQILGGMIRRMRKEEEEELKMEVVNKDYVPVRLRYSILRKCINRRQEVYGPVIDQRARYVDDGNAFDYEKFKEEWAKHLTFNIPGYETDGVNYSLVKSKTSVMKNIAKTYFEGMEWAMMYYTNMHEDQRRMSILNMSWFYPYFQAPLLSQLTDQLFNFLQEDGKQVLSEISSPAGNAERTLRGLFYYMDGMEITPEIKLSSSKLERDIMDVLPQDYFIKYPKLTDSVKEQISEYMTRTKLPRGSDPHQYVAKNVVEKPNYRYTGYNTFSSGWGRPRKFNYKTVLSAPSTTNYKSQLLAVLPPQSSKFFPDGWSPSDSRISWMYPRVVPVDFNFRPRTHYAILMLPPPNIDVINELVRVKSLELEVDNIRQGLFPSSVKKPMITEGVVKSGLHYESITEILRGELDITRGKYVAGLDVSFSGGLGALILSDFSYSVVCYESMREEMEAVVHNITGFDNIRMVRRVSEVDQLIDFEIFMIDDVDLVQNINELNRKNRNIDSKVFIVKTARTLPRIQVEDYETKVTSHMLEGGDKLYIIRLEKVYRRERSRDREYEGYGEGRVDIPSISPEMQLLRKIMGDATFDKDLMLTEESKYSVSYKSDIKQIIDRFGVMGEEIVDANANIGLSSYFLSKFYTKVTAIELDRDTFETAKYNLRVLGSENVTLVNNDAVKYTSEMEGKIIMFDPPWGGKDYAKKQNLNLFLSDVNIKDIIAKLLLNNNTILLKAPLNFDQSNFNFTDKLVVTRNNNPSYAVYLITPEL